MTHEAQAWLHAARERIGGRVLASPGADAWRDCGWVEPRRLHGDLEPIPIEPAGRDLVADPTREQAHDTVAEGRHDSVVAG